MSEPWIQRTFQRASRNALKDTVYLTANPHTEVLSSVEGLTVNDVWKPHTDPELGLVHPRTMTNLAIKKYRRSPPSTRLVVHYIQPHLPPVGDVDYDAGQFKPDAGRGNRWENIGWEQVKDGSVPAEDVIEAYRENLEIVLEELNLLLTNVNADNVVITSDHGNYLGEKDRYGHPRYHIHPAVREVPWWETSATDEQTHRPDIEEEDVVSSTRQDQLEALGYH